MPNWLNNLKRKCSILFYGRNFSPRYWKLRQQFAGLDFRFQKLRFKTKLALGGSIETGSIFRQALMLIFWRVLTALVAVLLLAWLEPLGYSRNIPYLRHTINSEAQLGFLGALV